MIFGTSIWSKWNIFTYVVPFAIAELGHKCLEQAATLKYDPLQLYHCSQRLNHEDIYMLYFCIPLAVIWKDDKIVTNQNAGLKVPLFDV